MLGLISVFLLGISAIPLAESFAQLLSASKELSSLKRSYLYEFILRKDMVWFVFGVLGGLLAALALVLRSQARDKTPI